MKIAIDARYLTSSIPRGMDRYVINLTKGLLARGHEVYWLARTREVIHSSHIQDCKVPVRYLKDLGVVYWDQVSIPLELLRGRYDIYHATCERSLPRWSPCPTIYTWHSATALSYQSLIKNGKVRAELLPDVSPKRSSVAVPKFHYFYYSAMPHWANKIITVSHFSRQEIIELAHVKPEKIVSIPLAASPEFSDTARRDDDCLAQFGLSGRSLYVLYVGGYESHKNPEGTIRAFHGFHRQHPEYVLVMVGTNSVPEQLLKLVAQLRISDSVKFLCNLTQELPALYLHAEMFLSMSWRESFGLPFLEAMSMGCPVVCSAWGAGPEVVGATGAFVDPNSPEDAAQAMTQLVHNRVRVRHHEAILSQAATFNWERCVDETINVYREAIAAPELMNSHL